MRVIRITRVVCAIAIAALLAGCGGSSGSSDDGGGDSGAGLSETQATAFAEQIAGSAVNAMNNMDVNASASQAIKTVQCNTETGTCTYNIPISYRTNCTAGGRMELSGGITGTTNIDGDGILQIGVTQTITDWECITGYIINGDPYVSLTGTFTFDGGAPATRNDMTISGGFKWGTTAAESCQISLSIIFYSDGSGTISGTVCGYSINASF